MRCCANGSPGTTTLPDGNKRVAYLCAVEFAERNGYAWEFPPGDERGGEQTVKVIEAIASGEMTEEQLAEWWQSG
ncbi:MAG: hypothetical protein ACRDJ5_02605 [Actinomycetota bacterium]